MSFPFYVALLHYPVLDRNQEVITSSVTNMDLHDIARSCRTFGVKGYFVVHPSPDEQALNRRILSHWNSGYGERSHPTRKDALGLVRLVHRFEDVEGQIQDETGQLPFKIGTSARVVGAQRHMRPDDLKRQLELSPVLLVFGTGYGLTSDWNSRLEAFLGPISGPSDFNHLSVRSAVAIYLDRLFGAK